MSNCFHKTVRELNLALRWIYLLHVFSTIAALASSRGWFGLCFHSAGIDFCKSISKFSILFLADVVTNYRGLSVLLTSFLWFILTFKHLAGSWPNNSKKYIFIHSSICFIRFVASGVTGVCWSLSQCVCVHIGQRQIWIGHHTDLLLSHKSRANLESLIEPNMNDFRLWEEKTEKTHADTRRTGEPLAAR